MTNRTLALFDEVQASGAVDSDYNPITYRSGALTVTLAGTATLLSSSLVTPPNSPTNITLTATVTSPTITPVGTVTFTDTSRSPVIVLGSATLSGGTASLTTTSTVLNGGPHLIGATYNPPPFTFVSSFSSGNTGPTVTITGPTFQVANLDFHSTVYQWLVISGPMAQYKGSGTITGTINGSGNYNFLLTGRDGSLAGGNTPDGFRIKITDPVSGATIYDNLLSTDNSATSANT